ncbi:hypothetical protein CRENBAI_025775 [Crenichthys baileyi]|uniref:Uncharacterized protein n=1 Tax=Crenichthys baileyi TaxID=28760 RepID=A0AAV9SCX7_9TELE
MDFQVLIPQRGNQPLDPRGGSLLPSFRGGDRHPHTSAAPAPAQTSADTAPMRVTLAHTPTRLSSPTPVPNDSDPHTKDGSTWFKRACQPELSQDETVPTPNEFPSQPHEPPTSHELQHESIHRATPDQDTDIEHLPPNPKAMNPFPTGAHPHR